MVFTAFNLVWLQRLVTGRDSMAPSLGRSSGKRHAAQGGGDSSRVQIKLKMLIFIFEHSGKQTSRHLGPTGNPEVQVVLQSFCQCLCSFCTKFQLSGGTALTKTWLNSLSSI